MKLCQVTKPVSFLQSHAPDMLRELADSSPTYVITEGGEARAVLLDIRAYEALQESLAFLKMLAISSRHLREGKVVSAENAFAHIRATLLTEAA